MHFVSLDNETSPDNNPTITKFARPLDHMMTHSNKAQETCSNAPSAHLDSQNNDTERLHGPSCIEDIIHHLACWPITLPLLLVAASPVFNVSKCVVNENLGVRIICAQ